MDRNKDLNKIVRDRNKLRHHSNYHAHHVETRQVGGRMGSSMASTDDCGPGYHMMPDGTCMEGDYHGASTSGMGSRMSSGYQRGGRARRRFQQGGHTHEIQQSATRHRHPIDPLNPTGAMTGHGQIMNLSQLGMPETSLAGSHHHSPGQSPMGGVRRSGRNRSTMRTYQNGGRSTMRTSRRPQVVGVGDHHHELNPHVWLF